MKTKSYLSESTELDALKTMPLESAYRNVKIDRVASRLLTERSLFEGSHLRNDQLKPWLSVVVAVERPPDAALAASVASVALQSCPHVRCLLVPSNPSVTEAMVKKFLKQKGLKPVVTEFMASLDAENRAVIRKSDYVTFLRHGDQLHPSAATWLAIHAKSSRPADVTAWGELQPAKDGRTLAWAQRNPALHREALLHFPHLRNAFAVSSKLACAYPGDLIRELIHNSLHLLQIWLVNRPNLTWSCHPEYFLIKTPEHAEMTPEGAAARAIADYGDAYSKLFATMRKDFAFARLPHDSPAPYKLTPVRRATSIAVIIPFRDKADLTLRAINSLARQTFKGFFEIVLVDNRSNPDSRARVLEGVEKLRDRFRIRIVDYEKPFNHSDQCNVGVKASLGEVIVFLNNDCEIVSPTALEEMAAWAVQPEVGSVGISIIDPSTGKAHAGMDARLAPTNYFDSTVEEKSAPAITPFVRRTFGNTFALCAINREMFEMLGGLDAIRFPNGYNDVDYACRANQAGLHHLSLGHLAATHSPGKSRASTDESPQKILVRTLYPSIVSQALETVTMDEMLVRLSGAVTAGAGQGGGRMPGVSSAAQPPAANGSALPRANGSLNVNGAAHVKSPPTFVVRIAQSSIFRPMMNNRIVGGVLRRVRRMIWPSAQQ
jgi:GT2 family glycosyltransferase